MRSEWEALHRGLVGSIGTKEAEQRFETLRNRVAVLARFDGAPALIEYLAHRGGDLDEKDRILAELVLATWEGPAAPLATTLLLLGLWPGLDAAFRRRVRFCQDHPGELAADMIASFTEQVRRLDLEKVHRVAATLVHSTERDVVRARIQEFERRHEMSALPIAVAERLAGPDWPTREVPSRAGAAADLRPPVVAGRSLEEEIAVLRAWLADLVGEDADLVIDALLLKRSREELGAERGIHRRAARKRLQRALLRIRRCLEKQISMSRERVGWRLRRHEHETREPDLSGLG